MNHVVVAEDDPFILRLISMWLGRQGFQVHEARNGLMALEHLQRQRADLLISDINMPSMDGLELLGRVMGTPLEPRGVIVLTNRWDHREISEQLRQWGVHVCTKPFSPSNLAALVERLVRGDGAAPPPSAQEASS